MDEQLRNKVQKKAYELFLGRNGDPRTSEEEWYAAEKMILGSNSKSVLRKVHETPLKKGLKKQH